MAFLQELDLQHFARIGSKFKVPRSKLGKAEIQILCHSIYDLRLAFGGARAAKPRSAQNT